MSHCNTTKWAYILVSKIFNPKMKSTNHTNAHISINLAQNEKSKTHLFFWTINVLQNMVLSALYMTMYDCLSVCWLRILHTISCCFFLLQMDKKDIIWVSAVCKCSNVVAMSWCLFIVQILMQIFGVNAFFGCWCIFWVLMHCLGFHAMLEC